MRRPNLTIVCANEIAAIVREAGTFVTVATDYPGSPKAQLICRDGINAPMWFIYDEKGFELYELGKRAMARLMAPEAVAERVANAFNQ